MTRSTSLIIGVIGGLAIAGTVGGYFLYRSMTKEVQPIQTPVPSTPHGRDNVEVPEIRFTDVTDSSGVRFRHNAGLSGVKLLPETMGGGAAILDYDGDGKPDLLFVNSCPWPGHPVVGPAPTLVLYRNKGDFTFEDVTTTAGLNVSIYGMGVAVGDYNNDGRPDLFVSCIGRHRLFRNVDGKKFVNVTDEAGVGGLGKLPDCSREEFLAWKSPIPFGSSCTFLDYDGDGKLDLFVCHYVTWSPSIDRAIGSSLEGLSRAFVQPKEFEGSQCALYRNVDGKRFEDVSATSGVQVFEKEGTGTTDRRRSVAKSLGVVACDPTGSGFPDLVVANDTVRNFYFRNKQGPNNRRIYEEIGQRSGVAYADEGKTRGGMGIDWSEYAPGRSAVVVANFANEPLTFLALEKPTPLFSDSALSTGIAGPSRAALKFGTFFFDYDLDGREDLLVCNGHIEPEIARVQASQKHAQPALLFWNTGNPDCRYEPVTANRAGADLFKPLVGRGAVYADFDGDGDVDVVLVANDGLARVLRNDAPKKNHWLRLNLVGDGVKSNRSAIGAEVEVQAGGQTFRRSITGARGYLSQPEMTVTVGLGNVEKVDKITIRWPGQSGGSETWTNLAIDRVHELKQGASK